MYNSSYAVYILTNRSRKLLYTGITFDLRKRLLEHKIGENKSSFTSRYNCYYLVYWEEHSDPAVAIAREKEIKGWLRQKKVELIESFNPEWRFLDEDILQELDADNEKKQ